MRFTRFERYTPIEFNARRQAAFACRQQRERDRYPLFPEHVAAEQHKADEEIDRRQHQADRFEASQRAFQACVWRGARTRFFSLPEAVKAQIRAKWPACPGPTTATNFIYIVDELSGDRARRVAEANPGHAEIRRRAWESVNRQSVLGGGLMAPTDEQDAVVDAVKGGDALKVKAYAGAGKTSTLRPTLVIRRHRDIFLLARWQRCHGTALAGVGQPDQRCVAILLFERSKSNYLTIVDAAAMLTNAQFLPCDSAHEVAMADHLGAQRRAFRKPLRHIGNAPVHPDFVLTDTSPEVVIEVLGMAGNPEYDTRMAAKHQHYRDASVPFVEWNAPAQPLSAVRLLSPVGTAPEATHAG